MDLTPQERTLLMVLGQVINPLVFNFLGEPANDIARTLYLKGLVEWNYSFKQSTGWRLTKAGRKKVEELMRRHVIMRVGNFAVSM